MNETSGRELLERLIGFSTVSRDSNLEMIEFIRHYLAAFGIESELFYNAERTKANLFATIGPSDRGGIVLSGHTDVVPVDGQPWTVDAFRLTERDGRLYGRGTADMKGFIASVLAAVPVFLGRALRLPVHLAFSYDEEVGCLGVRPMLAELEKRPHRPVLCLIGEPTEMKPEGAKFKTRHGMNPRRSPKVRSARQARAASPPMSMVTERSSAAPSSAASTIPEPSATPAVLRTIKPRMVSL